MTSWQYIHLYDSMNNQLFFRTCVGVFGVNLLDGFAQITIPTYYIFLIIYNQTTYNNTYPVADTRNRRA